MFRSLICQANLISSDFWAHRVTFYAWYLFSFLVFVEYSGILTASLVTPSFEKPIDSLVDLPRAVAAGSTIGLIEDSSFDQLFKESRGNVYAQTYALLNHKDRSRSFLKYAEEGFDRIMVEKYIILNGLSGSRTRAAQRGQRRFHFGKETFAPQFYGISCFRGAPFIPKFDQLLSRMVASGLITKWLEDEIRKHTENQVHDGDVGPKAISLRHLQAAFYIIPIGYFLATLAFSYEVLVSPKKRKGARSNALKNSHRGRVN
ncbi:probable glutamate receptor isoform X2 [Palaemon carinicauda]|uniref:probable glutamate receptor isoform X2 n=1 Tax=Palaemon carinicauda TaxID=392227 RepID=UPI0035B642E9